MITEHSISETVETSHSRNSSLETASAEWRGEKLFREPLARYTTLKVGGIADLLFYPEDLESLQEVIQSCHKQKIPFFVMGNGSNLLIRDEGIRGVVIRLQKLLKNFQIEEKQEELQIRAEAGVLLPKLVEKAKQNGWSGFESLYGIPATVGGALAMNAGTREGEIGARVLELTFLDAHGKKKTYSKEKLQFEYRSLKIHKSELILEALFSLSYSTPEKVAERVSFFQQRRLKTQPLDQANIGSIFKNPSSKIFAAKLIEEVGLKGVRVGGARISEKHSNWIVNEGGATARDVEILIGLVKDKVKEKMDVKLETEVKIIGEGK